VADYGLREDGTPKGDGFLGVLKRPDGQVSSELSFSAEVNGKKIFAPLIVPTLTRQELDHLLGGGQPTQQIYDKAIQHALERQKAGKDMFAIPGEIYPQPAPTPLTDILGR